MTGNRPKLRPCPFCGGEADYFYNADDGEVSDVTVSCTNLSCWFCIKDTDYVGSFPPCDTFEEAAELWNRRAGEMAEWTKEIDTDYSKIFIAHCNDGRKRLVEFVSNSFVVVNGNIRNGIDIFSFIDRYDPLWYKIPTPPLPGREGM